MLADSHAHFFSPGFAESLPESCRRSSPDEITLYQAFMQQWQIKAVLAVGFEGLKIHRGNNDYLATLARSHDWLYPLAYVKPAGLNLPWLMSRHQEKFVGLSMYMDAKDAKAMPSVDDKVWAWLADHQALVSVNTRGAVWKSWQPILKRHPNLRLLVSHMGLPGKWADVPTAKEAAVALKTVDQLAAYPQVRVKLSAFYATSDPYYDFPHPQALPVMEHIAHAFGVDRLMWGSDFCPALEYVSFPQTIAPLDRWEKITDSQRQAIKADNLLALIDEVSMGK